jgi:urocanate hydratase
MKIGLDAVVDRALLNCMASGTSGSASTNFHRIGSLGISYGRHAGQVSLENDMYEGESNVTAELRNDSALGIFVHADAGYERTVEITEK